MRLSPTLMLALALAVPREVRAQDQPQDRAAPSPRTLRGHTFAYPATIDAAFIDTLFGTRTSARYESIPNLPIGNNMVAVDSLGVAENVDFALALAEQVNVGIGVFGRTLFGTSARALATAGALYSYGVNFNAAYRILRLDDAGTQITLRGQIFGVQGGGRISLLPLIRAIRDNPPEDVPGTLANFGELLVTPVSWLGVAASLNVAQVITPVISVQGSFRLDMRRVTQSPFVVGTGRVDVASTSWIPQGGVAVGVVPPDWPVTLSGEYRLSAHSSDDPTSPARHVVVVAAYYSARLDLQVGPVIAGEFGFPELRGIDANGNPQGSDKGKATSGQLMMRYYW
jgi:hypothetical protein